MLVSEIMTPDPITIGPESDYLAAIALMRARKCRHLPVVDREKRLVGIVSGGDLSAVHTPGTPREHAIQGDGVLVRIREVMTNDVVTVPPDYPLEEAARLMLEHRIGCLPVVEDDQVAGIITDTDIFRTLVSMLGGGSPTIRLAVQVANTPGQIAALGRRIADVGGNILSIASHPAPSPDRMQLTLRIENVARADLLAVVGQHPGVVVRHVWEQRGTSPEY